MARIKGAGHQPLTEQIAKDWRASFLVNPQAFDGVIIIPKEDPTAEPMGEQASFGVLNDHQEVHEYELPEPVSIIEVKGEDSDWLTSGDTGESLGMGESEVFRCRLSPAFVPDGAVITYEEIVGDNQVTRWWYVHSSIQSGYGHFTQARIYYCVPFNDPETVLGNS